VTDSSLIKFLIDWIASVNPYFQTLPDNKRHKYIYDYLEEIKKSELITTEVSTDGTGEEKILYNYTMVVAGISKL
jgi:trans-aconitate methyltransferase